MRATSRLDADAVMACNAAAVRVIEALPPAHIADLPRKESDAHLTLMHELIQAEIASMTCDRGEVGREWVDVLASDGRWLGRWTDNYMVESVLHCLYWWHASDGLSAVEVGIGIRPTKEEVAAARAADVEAEAMRGGLLSLLGDW